MICIQQGITTQIRYKVLIPRPNISISVDIGIRHEQLDDIWISDMCKKKSQYHH